MTSLPTRYRRLQTLGAQIVLAWPHDVRGAAALMGQLGVLAQLGAAVPGTGRRRPDDARAGWRGGGWRPHASTSRLRVADDLWDHDTLTPVVRDFGREFRLRYGSAPDDESAAAWDAV